MLQNAPPLTIGGVDTVANGPSKVFVRWRICDSNRNLGYDYNVQNIYDLLDPALFSQTAETKLKGTKNAPIGEFGQLLLPLEFDEKLEKLQDLIAPAEKNLLPRLEALLSAAKFLPTRS